MEAAALPARTDTGHLSRCISVGPGVGAHLAKDYAAAASLFLAANMPSVRAWTESLWGSKAANPDQSRYQRYRKLDCTPPRLAKLDRIKKRDPSPAEKRAIVEHYGRNCLFCGIPLISDAVRDRIRRVYPEAVPWGSSNPTQHAAFQCMWLQFDHLLPHSRGGDNSLQNVVVTCAPCNYGRGDWTIEELGLLDPREFPLHKTSWDGLERFSD